jgi:hypothetical protein
MIQALVRLRVCTSCTVPISSMTLQLLSQTPKPDLGPPVPQAPPPPGFAARLDAAMRAQQQAARPRPGEELPYDPGPSDCGNLRAPIQVAHGTNPVNAWPPSHCVVTALLHSDRSVAAVFADYRDQVRKQANEAPPKVLAARHGGKRSRS